MQFRHHMDRTMARLTLKLAQSIAVLWRLREMAELRALRSLEHAE